MVAGKTCFGRVLLMDSLCQGIPCCVLSRGDQDKLWYVFCHAGVFSVQNFHDIRFAQLIKYLRQTSRAPAVLTRVFLDMSHLIGDLCLPEEILKAYDDAYAIFISSPGGEEVVRKTPSFTPLRLIMNPWTPLEIEKA